MKTSTKEPDANSERFVNPSGSEATGTALAGTPRCPRSEAAALRRVFVVQLATDCEPATVSLSGRVQHLETADGGNFESTEGLVAIVRRIFKRTGRGHAQD